jgi:hypothetical protein
LNSSSLKRISIILSALLKSLQNLGHDLLRFICQLPYGSLHLGDGLALPVLASVERAHSGIVFYPNTPFLSSE